MDTKVSSDQHNSIVSGSTVISKAVSDRTLLVPEGHEYVPVVVEEFRHDTTDSWIKAIISCRAAGGEMVNCDEPKRRLLGFVHHPDVPGVNSVHHLIGLGQMRSYPPTPEALAHLGAEVGSFREYLYDRNGRDWILTGKKPELRGTPERIEEYKALVEAMMHEGITVTPGPDGVEFPEVNLWRIPDLGFMEDERHAEWWKRTEALERWTNDSDWVPEGWARFVLPHDADRAGVKGEETEGEVHGAFLRRGAGVFRVFESGKWDRLQWYKKSYKVVKSGKCADPKSAIEAVLSSGSPEPFPAW